MRAMLATIKFPKESEFGLFSLVHGDRLGSMIGRFAIRSRLYAVSLAAMLSFSAALVAAFEGSLINASLTLDLAHDIGWWNQFLLVFPTLIYLTGSFFGEFPKTLRQLTDSGVLQATHSEWKKVRRFTKSKLSNLTFVLLPYVVGFSAAALTSNVLQSQGNWYSGEQYIAGLLIPVHAFFLYFFMTYLALRLYTTFLILRMLFCFTVNIQPFHADGCGGVGSLILLSGKLYWGMIAFGVATALGILSNTFVYSLELFSIYNFSLLMSYILLTGVAFFLPFYALTESMAAAKQKLLLTISERHKALLARQEGEHEPSEEEQAADLSALYSLKQTARSMQVWPFNKGSLIRFGYAIATPVLLVLIGAIILQ